MLLQEVLGKGIRTIATMRSDSCHAKGRPMHPRTPLPNGFQLSGGRFLNPPLSSLSGLPHQHSSNLPDTRNKNSLEDLGIVAPYFRIHMQGIQDNHTVLTFCDLVFTAKNLIPVLRGDTERRCCGLESECLFECRIDIFELRELFEFDGLVAAYSVDFFSDLLE